jgi:hypothetical protein
MRRLLNNSITWTGGSSGSAAGQFTVPSYVLATLPATSGGKPGSVSVGNTTVPQSFVATGLDYAYAVGQVAYNIDATYNQRTRSSLVKLS